jgi:hypothetical protein
MHGTKWPLQNLFANLVVGFAEAARTLGGQPLTFEFRPCAKLTWTSMPPRTEKQATASPRVPTIGHSNHTLEHFLCLLKAHGVQVVVDSRSQPYSKYATQFDHDALRLALQDAGIRYLYLGRELGGRPEGDEFYDDEGHVLYGRVAGTSLFQEGLSRLERGIHEYNVALLCAEENPAACHRRLLVGRVLLDHGFQVEHIRGDGRIQTEEEVAAEIDPNRDQLPLFQKVEAEPWKSIPSVLRKKRRNSETPSKSAPT